MIGFYKYLLVLALSIRFNCLCSWDFCSCKCLCSWDFCILWHDLRYRTSERPSILYTISTCDIEGYRRHETLISTSPFMTFDIEGFDLRYRIIRPSISNTFDIDILYQRCKTPISNAHSISKSSMSNVTIDIEGPTLDIGVARIQPGMYLHDWVKNCCPSCTFPLAFSGCRHREIIVNN